MADGWGDRKVALIAAGQRALVTSQQLAACGIGKGAIAYRLQQGRLHPVHRGVYAVGVPTLQPLARELAAVLALGPGSVLSHHSAAFVWGFRPARGLPVDVAVTGRCGSSRAGIRVHRLKQLNRIDLCLHDEIPITTPARTILDIAADLPRRELERAFDEALVRGLVRHDHVIDALRRTPGRRGCATLAALAQDHEPGSTVTRSEAEERLLALVGRGGLPRPRVNTQLRGYEVDFFWGPERLVVEVDGYAYHRARAKFESDRRRDAELQVAGLRVMRVTWRQIVEQPEALLVRLTQMLSAAADPRRRAGS